MTTLYVVTSRCDADDADGSEQHVHRIFSTREKAEAWIGPATRDYAVEEMTLDDPGASRPMTFYKIIMDALTGKLMRGDQRETEDRPVDFVSDSGVIDTYRPQIWAESSSSAEHAVEVAYAARMAYLDSLKAAPSYPPEWMSVATHQAKCLMEIQRMFDDAGPAAGSTG